MPNADMSDTLITIRRRKRKNLFRLLVHATELVENLSENMSSDQYQWQRKILGHNFTVLRSASSEYGDTCSRIMNTIRTWLYNNEDTQVMVASVLVVFGLWWLVRTILALLINLVCPLLVVLLAVVCVPQLRSPLLGQNYPALANVLRNILLKMANNIKTQ